MDTVTVKRVCVRRGLHRLRSKIVSKKIKKKENRKVFVSNRSNTGEIGDTSVIDDRNDSIIVSNRFRVSSFLNFEKSTTLITYVLGNDTQR